MPKSDLIQCLELVEKDFQLAPNYLNLEAQQEVSFDQAFLWIMRVVEELLAKDFEKLIHILYRIDVSEQKLKAALAETNDNPAAIIAKMILEREMQKVETRKKYRSKPD